MTSPACSRHGDALRDLALGRLEDDAARAAEALPRRCPECAAWWSRHVEAHLRPVDDAVAEAVASFSAPRRRRLPWWAAAAAATVLAAAGGLWMAQGPAPTATPAAAPGQVADGEPGAPPTEPLFRLDFEGGEASGVEVERESVSKLDFESGQLPSRRS